MNFIKNMYKLDIKILSWLLHHANRNCNENNFYSIKNKILKKYGQFINYDIQYIDGKKCWCGNGIYDYNWFDKEPIICYKCNGTGWYKLPVWNILEKVSFGKYQFHIPFERSYKKPIDYINQYPNSLIDGYIDHNNSKYGDIALNILYLIYDFKGYWKRWIKNVGFGWYVRWWLPKNYINNIAHLVKKRHKSIPIINLKKWINKTGKYKKCKIYHSSEFNIDNLPF